MIIFKKNEYKIYISEKEDGTAREIDDFIYTKQVHGDNIYVLEKEGEMISSENDGIISQLTNTKIGVVLADCNGVIIMGKNRYGVIHAGWRGLKNGIIKKTLDILQKKGEKTQTLNIYIGPSIRQCCYEVGEEFLEYFDKKYFDRRQGKLYFDMIGVLNDTLLELGISKENIEVHTDCTACSGNFFSYRKEKTSKRIVVGVEKYF